MMITYTHIHTYMIMKPWKNLGKKKEKKININTATHPVFLRPDLGLASYLALAYLINLTLDNDNKIKK